MKALDKYVATFPLQNQVGRFWRKLNKSPDGIIHCTNVAIGQNTLNKIPKKIAEVLNLPDPHKFTGQAFRGTALGIAAGKGANEQQLKQISGHTSVSSLSVYLTNSDISKRNSANFTSVGEQQSTSNSRVSEEKNASSAIHGGGGGQVTNIVNVYGNYNINNRYFGNASIPLNDTEPEITVHNDTL